MHTPDGITLEISNEHSSTAKAIEMTKKKTQDTTGLRTNNIKHAETKIVEYEAEHPNT